MVPSQDIDAPPKQAAYTGRSRRKSTPWTVKFSDIFARLLITVGGIGTIIAVCLVFVFLALVVIPLLHSPSTDEEAALEIGWNAKRPSHIAIDEYRTMGWALYDDGELQIFRTDTGETIERRSLFSDVKLTAISSVVGEDGLALGFEDGTIRFGAIEFTPEFRELQDMPPGLLEMKKGETASLEGGIVELTPQGQFRLQTVTSDLMPPIKIGDAPVKRLDHTNPSRNGGLGAKEFVAGVFCEDDTMRYCRVSESRNMFTGEFSLENQATDVPFESRPGKTVKSVLLTGRGDNLFLAWNDGRLIRYDTRDPSNIQAVESVELLAGSSAELTVCRFIIGRETILCGDSLGGLRGWFRVRREDDNPGQDAFQTAMVHDLSVGGTAVTSIGASERSRMVSVGYEDGTLRLFHVTTDQLMMEHTVSDGQPITDAVMAPKDDGLFAVTSDGAWQCRLEPAHPEATVASLFGPVWYEGYNEPLHIWQSSFAGVGPEMKLGLWPLIFGTLKATFYSMLFGAPLALLAAIYTSEFLSKRTRSRIKPAVEMMASLPSVVLGFLAALVFAPLVENVVPAALTCFVTVPLTLLLAAQLWHLIPYRMALILAPYRFVFAFCITPVGFVVAWLVGPMVETWFFAGDIKRWLDGQIGNAIGGWIILMLPIFAVIALAGTTLYINPWLRTNARRWNRAQFAWLNLGKFVIVTALAFAGAYLVSFALNAIGWDPRGSFVDTYEQRNALVVGFVMGFAIIPIIYTIADDALTTVPNHLRSGSLGCGATPWQTAWRVVIPTAMSGLFSALMIGLGRAVGETMIVLMAGGNTPVTDWNIFNGFRTLAANIAVELPEAVRNSTHYRTLFLAALTLFVLTFVINTMAEIVRLRFRRRAYQL